MNHRFAIPALCIAGVLVAIITWWFVADPGGNDDKDSTPLAGKAARPDRPVDSAAAASPQDELRAISTEIRAMSRADAVARISAILASGRDFESGHEFMLDSDGNLAAAPTLRTMLLDELATMDPANAAEISREILDTPTTADEWAIALRNLGRVDDSPETSAFLHEKAVELIRNPEWQAEPSVGYLNAFDVLVHTEATAEAPLLSDLIKNKDRKDLAHAAFLTLDRLVQRQPAVMLAQLGTDAALSASRPEMTAQQFARADLRDESQREIVARWLLHPERTATELNAFAGVFPNHNQFVSNNLLTRDTASAGADLAAHDREVLEVVTSWADDPDFKPLNEHLSVMISRLESFANAPQSSSSAPNE